MLIFALSYVYEWISLPIALPTQLDIPNSSRVSWEQDFHQLGESENKVMRCNPWMSVNEELLKCILLSAKWQSSCKCFAMPHYALFQSLQLNFIAKSIAQMRWSTEAKVEWQTSREIKRQKRNKLERKSGVQHCRSQPYPTDHTVVSNICSAFWNYQRHNKSSSSLQTMYVAVAAAGVQNSGIMNSTATACWCHTLSANICSYD